MSKTVALKQANASTSKVYFSQGYRYTDAAGRESRHWDTYAQAAHCRRVAVVREALVLMGFGHIDAEEAALEAVTYNVGSPLLDAFSSALARMPKQAA